MNKDKPNKNELNKIVDVLIDDVLELSDVWNEERTPTHIRFQELKDIKEDFINNIIAALDDDSRADN
ncbi:MAG: hypothetical protein MOGMAGMI_01815 [Candidatus Omnitrophica bacterium]|nr:hypothetical protein [Ignavibacteriaceae bacterium]MCG3176851.1 hypothetical protein [Candidatus Omnitrophota bacterium]